jgi:multisubunit Na+/H+ antiporter MnhB subunit
MSAQPEQSKLFAMASSVYTTQDAAYWYVPLVRAVPAAAVACVVTFAGGHYTPEFGLLAFGGFALVSGLLAFVLSFLAVARGVIRTVFLVQAVVAVVAGVGALIAAGTSGGLPAFLAFVGGWAVITGFLELYVGLRSRRGRAASRDWIFVGALTVVFAVVALVIPPGYVQHYTGPDHEPRILNASVMIVGALGVYGAIVAVYLVIAALSLKWGPSTAPRNGTAS